MGSPLPQPSTVAGARCKCTVCLCCKGTLGPSFLGTGETEAGSREAACLGGSGAPAPCTWVLHCCGVQHPHHRS